MGSHSAKVGHLPTPRLTLVNTSPAGVSLQWNLPRAYSGVSRYIVEYGTDGVSYPTTAYDGPNLSTVYKPTWQDGVPMYFRVRYESTAGKYSAYSNTESKTLYAPVVSAFAPTSLTFQATGGTYDWAQWISDADTNPVYTYNLSAKYRPDITINQTTGLMSVPASANGTSGSCALLVTDEYGLSDSWDFSVTVQQATTKPSAPSNLTVSGFNSTTLAVSWDASIPGSSAIAGYNVERATSANGTYSPVEEYVNPNLSVNDGNLTTGTTYWYRVRAYDLNGLQSDWTIPSISGTPVATTARNLYAESSFASGQITKQPSSRTDTTANRMNNAMFIKAVAQVQPANANIKWANTSNASPSVFSAIGKGGSEEYDVFVTAGETVVQGGLTDVITPREGPYFLRSMCYAGADILPGYAPNYNDLTKHYEGPNDDTLGDSGSHIADKCKPRSESAMMLSNSAYGVAYDTQFFHGFSLRLHKHHENCNKSTGATRPGNLSGPQLGEMNTPQGTQTTHMEFHLTIPENSDINALAGPPYNKTILETVGAQTDAWWCIWISRNPSGETTSNLLKVALAPIKPLSNAASDRGKWTDFIIEMCLNPFTTAQTASGWNFRPNTGLVRIWKSTGIPDSKNNRSMSKTLQYVDGSQGGLIFELKGPVGNIPPVGFPTQMPHCNLGQKHYCYMIKGMQPGGFSNSHGYYLGMAAVRDGYAENRQHSASNGSANSNIVNQFQGGKATTWEDVQPRG